MDNRHPWPGPYGGSGRGRATPQNRPYVQPRSLAPYFRPQQQQQQQQLFPSWRDIPEKADRAVAKARQEIIAKGESVSAWQVSQAALLMLEAGPSSALAQQMQQLRSLQALIAIESKVRTYLREYDRIIRIPCVHRCSLRSVTCFCSKVSIEVYVNNHLHESPFRDGKVEAA